MHSDLSAEVKRAVREALAEIGTDKLASSVKTFAKRIDAGPTTVYAEIKAGRLKARRLGDKMGNSQSPTAGPTSPACLSRRPRDRPCHTTTPRRRTGALRICRWLAMLRSVAPPVETIQNSIDGLINGATLACNAPANIVTKVTMSSAERVRRHRARKRLEAQLQLDELTFVRPDWALFLDPKRLPQKAGCRADQVRALALKELVDNGLDHAANVTLEQIDKDTWSVADDGPGMDAGANRHPVRGRPAPDLQQAPAPADPRCCRQRSARRDGCGDRIRGCPVGREPRPAVRDQGRPRYRPNAGRGGVM